MITITIDRNRISNHFKANVSVNSDVPVTAYEARATLIGERYGKGIGYDLLSDDIASSNGVVNLSSPVSSFSFDIESAELSADGEYRIVVYVKNESGVWNDCCQFYTSASEVIRDSNNDYVLAKRTGIGTDTLYKSTFTGNDINNFVTEVLS